MSFNNGDAIATQSQINQIKDYEEKIDSINVRAKNGILAVEHKFNFLRAELLEKRKSIISKIPNFWSTVFENHPDVRSFFDPDVLRYMRDFELVFSNNMRGSYSLNFYFNDNPYFENEVLTKYYDFEDEESEACFVIPIEWKKKPLQESQEPTGTGKRQLPQEDFFAWYNDHKIDRANSITRVMKEELWSDPLRFYFNEDEKNKYVACNA